MNNKSGEILIAICVIITVIPLLLGFYSDAKMEKNQKDQNNKMQKMVLNKYNNVV